ncbi:NRDE protein-domain-containing protein [Blyttiomyces helicus]|uniref:NRDE protein-domain-containing protein n=1 Tax=Blyttiomyces helicus TaxID=388810 RepID=A0A4P9WQ55_9FUNG|nr:NRDE protein-domain-containing protein [Blyttiomyces helicus]|eukprot:RKO92986.1 NRDE protein-domain-containing protein [Blyttiomyces helicus]
MCTSLFFVGTKNSSTKFRFVLAHNRDEYLARETVRVHEQPAGDASFYGPTDLRAGGTWIGMSRNGRVCWLTNVREPPPRPANGKSRGLLVSESFAGAQSVAHRVAEIAESKGAYNGFNFVIADVGGDEPVAFYCGNRVPAGEEGWRQVRGGVVLGMSNGVDFVDGPTDWPKVEAGKAAFAQAIEEAQNSEDLIDKILRLMSDQTEYQTAFPAGMFNRELERALSPVCIHPSRCRGEYGTRTSTVIVVDHDGKAIYTEVDGVHEREPTRTDIRFDIE